MSAEAQANLFQFFTLIFSHVQRRLVYIKTLMEINQHSFLSFTHMANTLAHCSVTETLENIPNFDPVESLETKVLVCRNQIGSKAYIKTKCTGIEKSGQTLLTPRYGMNSIL